MQLLKKKGIFLRSFFFSIFFVSTISACGDDDSKIDFERVPVENGHTRYRREVSISDRKACKPGDEEPLKRVNTTDRLAALRQKLNLYNIDAFLIPSGDSHQSEYVANADKRREWIAGFSGSSGFAVVTREKAALWTDGRYFIQAEDELDCNWLFMKGQEDDDASWFKWLKDELPVGSRIGADPSLTGALTWLEWQEYFQKQNMTLVTLIKNPIDEIWMDQPERSKDPLMVHEVKFAGKSWEEKVSELRDYLERKGYDAMVVTALDEIGWLFNIRGNDIPYNPFFRAYVVIDFDKIILYLPPEKQTQNVKDHLGSETCNDKSCVEIRDYEVIFEDLPGLSENWQKVLLGKKWAYTGGSSYAVFGLIPEAKRHLELSPIMLAKAQKNEVEISGMKAAYIRDAVALIEFSEILATSMAQGDTWTELKAAETLEKLRSAQKYAKGPSFSPISAYGSNGAIIHYKPDNITNAKIGKERFFLLDTGGQYLDGTTDVSRTFHFGTASDFEREVYTRVLMGSIDLARATFLDGTPDTRLDILARRNLYQVGLNYRHGTGHGIGAFGFIHESPIQVRVYASEEHPMREGYFFSDEPGYYEPGVGGVRLETVLMTVKKPSLKYSDKEYGTFLGFEPVCLVPFETSLIDYSLLTMAHIEWLNYYNGLIRQKVGEELKRQGKDKAYEWMLERTKPIYPKSPRSGRANAGSNKSSAFILTSICLILLTFIIEI